MRPRVARHGACQPELPIQRLLELSPEMGLHPTRVRLLIDHQRMVPSYLIDGRRDDTQHETLAREFQRSWRQHEGHGDGDRPHGGIGTGVSALLREPGHPCFQLAMTHAAAHEVRMTWQLAPDGGWRGAPGRAQLLPHGVRPPDRGSESP